MARREVKALHHRPYRYVGGPAASVVVLSPRCSHATQAPPVDFGAEAFSAGSVAALFPPPGECVCFFIFLLFFSLSQAPAHLWCGSAARALTVALHRIDPPLAPEALRRARVPTVPTLRNPLPDAGHPFWRESDVAEQVRLACRPLRRMRLRKNPTLSLGKSLTSPFMPAQVISTCAALEAERISALESVSSTIGGLTVSTVVHWLGRYQRCRGVSPAAVDAVGSCE